MSQIVGHISQVIGPVVDVYFEGTEAEMMLPSIHDALEIKRSNGKRLIVEVQQHIGENTVRTVAMDSTDGLQRGMTVHPLGGPITMPIGTQIKGRLMNVVGDSIDGMKELDRTGAYPIHRDPPKFEDLTTRLVGSEMCIRDRPYKRCFIQASRLSTCWNHIARAVKSVCLVAPV